MKRETSNGEIKAAERSEIFHEQYGNQLDAGVTLAGIVEKTGDYLSRIVGPDDADVAMARIVAGVVEVSGNSLQTAEGWRDALNRSTGSCFSEWPLGRKLHDLAAYAIYGIVLDEGVSNEDELAQRIERMVTDSEEFLAATPIGEWGINAGHDSDLSRLVRLASNRWALDNRQPVEPAALAEFGGVSEGRIRNMMSGANRMFANEDGRIPAHEALDWLAGRSEFWNSIWREQRLPQHSVKRTVELSRPIFVPVARDGTAFHPGLRRGANFTVGEKGSEVQIADFDKALDELQRMPVPYWRRPNPIGNWGIVSGVRWERLDASDLQFLAENPDHKISSG